MISAYPVTPQTQHIESSPALLPLLLNLKTTHLITIYCGWGTAQAKKMCQALSFVMYLQEILTALRSTELSPRRLSPRCLSSDGCVFEGNSGSPTTQIIEIIQPRWVIPGLLRANANVMLMLLHGNLVESEPRCKFCCHWKSWGGSDWTVPDSSSFWWN